MKNASRYAIYSVIAIAAAGAIGFVVMTNVPHTDQVVPEGEENTTPEITTPIESTQDLKKFSSADELRKYLLDTQTNFALQNQGGIAIDVMLHPTM